MCLVKHNAAPWIKKAGVDTKWSPKVLEIQRIFYLDLVGVDKNKNVL